MSETIPTDKEIMALAESDFNGEVPVPKAGESPWSISFYRTIYTLLQRIKAVEKPSLSARALEFGIGEVADLALYRKHALERAGKTIAELKAELAERQKGGEA